ncbi:hypothetical protein MK394_01520 [Streptococcus sanguinis]|uniref:Uncharacterized protein n=1 Tax=Streptococcus sanguinis SK115 TaxID=888810 RepID=F0I7P3_STRSA|nr:hypothetical protein [Streptococcus sanguinis]EGD32398.1 hypothetical protein HMPREF9382_1352 [Streptococcus sanguinis SK115]MCY7031548.1 hypothetical protein [Streptococcus sanguinis]
MLVWVILRVAEAEDLEEATGQEEVVGQEGAIDQEERVVTVRAQSLEQD